MQASDSKNLTKLTVILKGLQNEKFKEHINNNCNYRTICIL